MPENVEDSNKAHLCCIECLLISACCRSSFLSGNWVIGHFLESGVRRAPPSTTFAKNKGWWRDANWCLNVSKFEDTKWQTSILYQDFCHMCEKASSWFWQEYQVSTLEVLTDSAGPCFVENMKCLWTSFKLNSIKCLKRWQKLPHQRFVISLTQQCRMQTLVTLHDCWHARKPLQWIQQLNWWVKSGS